MIKLDPRTRIAIVFITTTAAVMIKDLKPLAFLLLLTLLFCRLFCISMIRAMSKMKRFFYFFIVLALIQSMFSAGGETILSLGSIRILTTAGLISGVSVMLRMSIIIFSALIIASSPPLEVVYGLMAMKMPQEIAFMVLLAMKFLPLFKEEFTDSIIAVQLAGADLTHIPLRKKLSLYTYILTPSVVKALHRARYISLSMECRGFRAYPHRTNYCRLKMRASDYITILTGLVLVLIIII